MIKNSVIFCENNLYYKDVFEIRYKNKKEINDKPNYKAFPFYDLRELIPRMFGKAVVGYEIDVDVFDLEFILSLLATISINHKKYFVLISDYRVYDNSLLPVSEKDYPLPYQSMSKAILKIEEFVKENFENWLIVRKPDIYGVGFGVVENIIKLHNETGILYIPDEDDWYVPTIGINDFRATLEKIISFRLNKQIINIVSQTFDLKMLQFFVNDGIVIKTLPRKELVKNSINMVSLICDKLYRAKETPRNYLLTYEKILKKKEEKKR